MPGFLIGSALLSALLAGQAQNLNQGPIPLPSGPPETRLSRPLPSPAGPPANPNRPLGRSPGMPAHYVGRPLTLSEAIAVALAVNPTLATAGQNVEFYRGGVQVANSALGPMIGVTPGENLIHHKAEPGYGIAATLPIDITHLLTSATEQARFQEIGARLDVNRIRNQLVYNVETAFFAVLRSKALARVADQDLEDSLERLHDAQVRYAAQAVAYIDVLRAQTDVATSQRQVIAARSAVSDAIATLNNAMGIEVTTKTDTTEAGAVREPNGVAPPPPPPPSQPTVSEEDLAKLIPAPPAEGLPTQTPEEQMRSADAAAGKATNLGPEFQSALAEALQTRPEIYEADASISAAKKGIVVAQRSILPSLSVGVGYFDLRSVTGTRYQEPQAFVGLTIPLVDSGLAQGRVREARATVSEAVTQRREEIDAVTLDVQQAYLAVVQARDQVAVTNQALAQAQAAFDLARIRYTVGVASKAGLSPQLEFADAQAALTQAAQNQVGALYDYNDARAQLDRSVGRLAYAGGNEDDGFPSVPSLRAVGR